MWSGVSICSGSTYCCIISLFSDTWFILGFRTLVVILIWLSTWVCVCVCVCVYWYIYMYGCKSYLFSLCPYVYIIVFFFFLLLTFISFKIEQPCWAQINLDMNVIVPSINWVLSDFLMPLLSKLEWCTKLRLCAAWPSWICWPFCLNWV